MTVPDTGIERLIHFVDARIAQLNLSKEEIARRGGPSADTLGKIRSRTNARTPNVETLLRLDRSVGWQPGSSAVTLLGGRPLSVTATGSAGGRPRSQTADIPVTSHEILYRLAEHTKDTIGHLDRIVEEIRGRAEAVRTIHEHFLTELAASGDLVSEFQASYKASTVRGRKRKPSS